MRRDSIHFTSLFAAYRNSLHRVRSFIVLQLSAWSTNMDSFLEALNTFLISFLHPVLGHSNSITWSKELSSVWWAWIQVWITALRAEARSSIGPWASGRVLLYAIWNSSLVVSKFINFDLLLDTNLKWALTSRLSRQVKLNLLWTCSLRHARFMWQRLARMRLMGSHVCFSTIANHVMIYRAFHLTNRASARLKSRETDATISVIFVSSASAVGSMTNTVMVHAVKMRDIVATWLCVVTFVRSASVHLLEVFEVDFVVFQDAVVVYSCAWLLLVKLVLEDANLICECLKLLVERRVLDWIRCRCLVIVLVAFFTHRVTTWVFLQLPLLSLGLLL